MKKQFDLYHVSRIPGKEDPGNETRWEYRFSGYSGSDEHLLCRLVVCRKDLEDPFFSGHFVINETNSGFDSLKSLVGVADIHDEADDKTRMLMREKIERRFNQMEGNLRRKYIVERNGIERDEEIDPMEKQELISLAYEREKEELDGLKDRKNNLIDECGIYKIREPRKLEVTASHPEPKTEPSDLSDSRQKFSNQNL